jgi:hypothetical protein
MDTTLQKIPEQSTLLTVDEVAIQLRVKRSWVYSHADALGVFRLGKYLRFSWPKVLERLEKKVMACSVGTPTRLPSQTPDSKRSNTALAGHRNAKPSQD